MANSKRKTRLKRVAELVEGAVHVGLQYIVLFYTDRCFQQPLLVKRVGAGTEVITSGIF